MDLYFFSRFILINMGLDRNCMDKPYLIGRATALVESLVDVPSDFVAIVQVNPLQKLPYYLREALKVEDGELEEVANAIGEIPSPFVDRNAQYYIGYYHQKNEIEKLEYRKEIGNRISEIRKQRGLTQAELSEMTGLQQVNISKIETGKYNVSIDILNKVCKALEVEIKIE